MALGIVSDEEFGKEFERIDNNSKNQVVSEVVKDSSLIEFLEIKKPGRREGDVEVPEVLRKIIGGEAIENSSKSARELAEMLDISSSQVGAYKNGVTSCASYNDKKDIDLTNFLTKTRNKASKRAHKTLNEALGAITPEKLENTKARDLAGIAKDMSMVIRNLDPRDDEDNDKSQGGITYQIYAPVVKTENHYETIQVTD